MARRSLDGLVIPAQAISTAVEGSPSGGLSLFTRFHSDHPARIGACIRSAILKIFIANRRNAAFADGGTPSAERTFGAMRRNEEDCAHDCVLAGCDNAACAATENNRTFRPQADRIPAREFQDIRGTRMDPQRSVAAMPDANARAVRPISLLLWEGDRCQAMERPLPAALRRQFSVGSLPTIRSFFPSEGARPSPS